MPASKQLLNPCRKVSLSISNFIPQISPVLNGALQLSICFNLVLFPFFEARLKYYCLYSFRYFMEYVFIPSILDKVDPTLVISSCVNIRKSDFHKWALRCIAKIEY